MQEITDEQIKRAKEKEKILLFFAEHNIICIEIDADFYIIGWDKQIAIVMISVLPKIQTNFRKLLSFHGIPTKHLTSVRSAQNLTGLAPMISQAKKMLKLLKGMKEVRSDLAKAEGIKNPGQQVKSLKKQGYIISIVDIDRMDGDKRKILKSYIYIGDGAGTKNIIQ